MRRQAAVQLLRALGRAGSDAAASAKHSNSCAAAGLLATRGFADDASLKKTVLYDYHVANGGGRGPRLPPPPPPPVPCVLAPCQPASLLHIWVHCASFIRAAG